MMAGLDNGHMPRWLSHISVAVPGLPELLAYNRADLPADIIAGLSVAAVALPVGVAYAQLAGFRPEVGLYSSVLPLVAYSLFGTSRQLIVGPDATTCALVAAAVMPLASGDKELYASLSVTLAFLAGVFCILARFFRLGGVADLLSKPILVGFLNGMALSIALAQIGKIFGIPIVKQGIIPRLIEFASEIRMAQPLTLATAAVAILVLAVSPRLMPRLPAALAAMVITGAAVRILGLDAAGVETIGPLRAGLPRISIPSFPLDLLPNLFAEAAGLALIAFSSMMLTARSFAAKNRYEIDVDREFAALGAANIASALSQGFAVSGADSRTAMSDASGGRTRVTGLITAVTVAVVLLFFTGPIQYVPVAALGAVLGKAAFSLLDLRALKTFYRLDRRELALSLFATLGVATLGVIKSILLVVILALLRFVTLVSRPKVETLGFVPGTPGLHSIDRHPNAVTLSGLLVLRFNAPIVFFNAPFFRRSVMQSIMAAEPDLKWVVVDMIPITMIDLTGLDVLREVIELLSARGVTLITAGRQTEWRHWAERRQLRYGWYSFPTLRAAIKAYKADTLPPVAGLRG
jgi:high affinity sulfate transporter 1